MKTVSPLIYCAVCALAGCTQTYVPAKPRPDYFSQRRTITGSNIPLAPGKLPPAQVSANAPVESVARDVPSLYPTEPVVGASHNHDPGTAPSNVGAGPAGSNPVPYSAPN